MGDGEKCLIGGAIILEGSLSLLQFLKVRPHCLINDVLDVSSPNKNRKIGIN